jgi:quercetin dioxygenase-like cupin family protein
MGAQMPTITPDDAIVHRMHGSSFTSYVSPSSGSQQLCAWQLDIAADTAGVAHRVTHEEVLLVLSGTLLAELDGVVQTANRGDVVRVPANASFRVSTGEQPGRAWVVTSVGLQAVTDDGTRITPPWTT